MGVLRFARDRPFTPAATQADLRRAFAYRAGRRMSDAEVTRALNVEWDTMVKRWVALGRWIARLEEADAYQAVPRHTGIRTHDGVWRAKESVAQKASWARRKAAALAKEA